MRSLMELSEFELLYKAIGNLTIRAGQLSTGQQKVLLFLAACISPRLLILLDEPFAGMSPELKLNAASFVKKWTAEGSLVILTEPSYPLEEPRGAY